MFAARALAGKRNERRDATVSGDLGASLHSVERAGARAVAAGGKAGKQVAADDLLIEIEVAE